MAERIREALEDAFEQEVRDHLREGRAAPVERLHDYLTGVGNKAFIAELMPKFPVYTCFLSEDARAVIGKVHTHTEPALNMLKSEGFSYQGYVDIFDAGPAVECETDKIRAVRESEALVLAIGTPGDDATPYLIHNRKREDCRITAAPARLAAGTLVVDPMTAKRLQLSAGDQVRAVTLSAQPVAPREKQ